MKTATRQTALRGNALALGRPLALLALLALAGCGVSFSAQVRPETCESDDDCGEGLQCIDRACTDTRITDVSPLSVELSPPPDAGPFARTQIRHLDVDEALVLELPEAAIFDRTIVLDPKSGEEVVATVSLIGEDRIPGREVDTRITVSPSAPSSLRVNPGRYTARIRPNGESRPGLEVEGWEVNRAKSSPVKEFRLGTGARRLSGRVTRRTMQSETLSGVSVSAVSMPSGLVSEYGTTDDEGRFDIELPETIDTAFLLTASDPSRPTSWAFQQVVNVPKEMARQLDIGLEATAPESIGRGRIQIFGTDRLGEDPVPVYGATAVLTATTSLPTRTFSVRGTTDEEGRVQTDSVEGVEVVAARYVLQIEPPPGSPFARTSTVVDLRSVEPNLIVDKQIALRPRTLVEGHITSSLGLDLAGASIQFDTLGTTRRPVSIAADNEGRFEAYLDPGEYVVRIEGGRTSAATAEASPPTFFLFEVLQTEETMELFYSVPSGRLLEGTVRGPDGPVSGVGVEFFVELEGRAVSLGSTRSDASGHFDVLVSSVEIPD